LSQIGLWCRISFFLKKEVISRPRAEGMGGSKKREEVKEEEADF